MASPYVYTTTLPLKKKKNITEFAMVLSVIMDIILILMETVMVLIGL